VVVAGFILLWVLTAASSTSTTPHEFARVTTNSNRQCVTGEQLQNDMCVPQDRFPIPAEPLIMDSETRPCDSFFKHACGTWINEHTNENRAFGAVSLANSRAIHEIVTSAPVESPIGTFYKSCVDTVVRGKHLRENTLERDHMRRTILDDFWRIEDLPTVLGRLARVGYTTPFSVTVEKHPIQSSIVPLIRWDGFEGVDEDVIAIIFTGSGANGYLEANTKISQFLKVQKELNKHHTHAEDSITSYTQYLDDGAFHRDLTNMGELTRDASFVWQRFYEEIDGTALGYLAQDTQQVWCPDRSYVEWFTRSGSTSFTVLEWRAWIEFSILYHTHNYAPDLPDNSYFREHEWAPVGYRAARNVPHVFKRSVVGTRFTENDCVRMTQHLLPGLVSQAYLEQSFAGSAEQTRLRVQRLGEQIRDHVAKLIDESEWLGKCVAHIYPLREAVTIPGGDTKTLRGQTLRV